jgi:8-oxo-dGTP pyrophosphatase MutT (NUDIX family)
MRRLLHIILCDTSFPSCLAAATPVRSLGLLPPGESFCFIVNTMRTIHREIVSALIFSKDGKLLIGMKDAGKGGVYADCWHIPGGGINNGESQLTALRREIMEETGIDITHATIDLVDDQGRGESKKMVKGGETVLCKMKFTVYRVDINKDAITMQTNLGSDLKKLEWVNLTDLTTYKLTPPSVTLFTKLGYLSK